MISEIKKNIKEKIGKSIIICVDVGRNKEEIYEGIVYKVYDYIWTLKTKTDIKSFSYNDVLSKFVVIDSLI